MCSHNIQDGQVALNFKQLTKQHSHTPGPSTPFPPSAPPGLLALSQTQWPVKLPIETIRSGFIVTPFLKTPAQPCGNQVRHVRTTIAREQSRPDISPGRKYKSKSPAPASQTSLYNHELVRKIEILSLK